ELGEVALDELAELVRTAHPPRSHASRARAPAPPPSRAPTAGRGPRAPCRRPRPPRAVRARLGSPRASPAAPRSARAGGRRRPRPPLAMDVAEDRFPGPSSLPGGVLLCKPHRLVDHGRRRNLTCVQLVDGNAEDVPLDGTEPVGRPAGLGGGRGDPAI